jgi:hypothetical protein
MSGSAGLGQAAGHDPERLEHALQPLGLGLALLAERLSTFHTRSAPKSLSIRHGAAACRSGRGSRGRRTGRLPPRRTRRCGSAGRGAGVHDALGRGGDDAAAGRIVQRAGAKVPAVEVAGDQHRSALGSRPGTSAMTLPERP